MFVKPFGRVLGFILLPLAAAIPAPITPGQEATLAGTKQPVPDAAARKKALAQLQQHHGADLSRAARDRKAALELAATLLEKGTHSDQDAARRYVLLEMAATLAAKGGDAAAALTAVDELARAFEVDVAALKVKSLDDAVRSSNGPDEFKRLVDVVLNEMNDAQERDAYEEAMELAKVAEDAALKTKQLPLVLSVRRLRRGVEAARAKYTHLQPFANRLKKDPTDPEANAQVGRYLCLHKGDWERGLFLLAQGNDAALRTLAQRDLAHPDRAERRTAVGDAWWEFAEKLSDQSRIHVRQRAVYWYEQVVHSAEGELKRRLEERIAAVPPPLHRAIVWDHSGPPGLIRLLGRHNSNVFGVAFSPDGKFILSGGVDNRAILWDAHTGKELATIQGHFGMIWSVAWDPKGKFFYTASWDGTIKMWDAKTYREVRRFPAAGRLADINGISISPDGKLLLCGTDDNSIRVYETHTGNQVKQLHGHRGFVYGVAFSPDGKRLLSGGSNDQQLLYWDYKTGQILQRFNVPGPIRNVAFHPDGQKAAAAGEAVVRLWDLKTGREIRSFQGHTAMVNALAFSRDGRRLVTAGHDNTIRYWDVATGKQIHVLAGGVGGAIFALDLSPGGGRVVTGAGDNTVQLWGLPRK